MLTRRVYLLLFCFCCSVHTLYGQQDSGVLKTAADAIPAASDSIGNFEGLQLLGEVVIRKRFAVRVDKDTTTFTADSIIARQFDNLEELMRRIPGIQVATDGSILYNGLPIRQVGIDGTPLTSLDPRRLLQLLRGRDVDQLKIYNLETTAENPGRFRDRQEKGLDIRLKEEAKRGYYGKLAAGAGKGAQTQWDQSADISSFTDERKLSAYMLSGNMGGQSTFSSTELPGQNSSSLPRGTPGNSTAGIFYDKKVNKRLSVNGNYSMNRNTQNLMQQVTERRFLPSGSNNAATYAHSGIKTFSNSVTVQLGYTIDSLSYFSLMANSGFSNSGGSDNTSTITNNEDSLLISSSRFTNTYKIQNPNAALVLSYNKRFRRAGALTCSFAPNWNSSTTRTGQYSHLDLAVSGKVQEFAQQKYNTESNRIYTMNVDYKYPVSRQFFIGLNWQGGWIQSESVQETYDLDAGKQVADTLNPLYSNHYRIGKVSNTWGAFANFTGKKYTVRFGSDIHSLTWKQQDVDLNTSLARHFINLVPSASLRVAFSKQSVTNISYQLQFTQPGLGQIQPLVNNTDPMNIVMGNPGLTQSSAHNTNAGYTFTSSDGRKALYAGTGLSIIRNAISLGQFADENGRRTFRYYNQDGNSNSTLSLNYSQSIGKRIRLSAGPAAGFSKTVSMVNNEENTTFSQSYSSLFSLTYTKDTALTIRLETMASCILTRASLNISGKRNYVMNYGGILNINYSLPFGGVSVGTSCSWSNIKGNTGNGANFLIWNISVQQEMNKSKSLVAKLYVYDLLNRNKGYLAYNELNMQREESFNSIERFFLLGLIWHFTKR